MTSSIRIALHIGITYYCKFLNSSVTWRWIHSPALSHRSIIVLYDLHNWTKLGTGCTDFNVTFGYEIRHHNRTTLYDNGRDIDVETYFWFLSAGNPIAYHIQGYTHLIFKSCYYANNKIEKCYNLFDINIWQIFSINKRMALLILLIH